MRARWSLACIQNIVEIGQSADMRRLRIIGEANAPTNPFTLLLPLQTHRILL